MKKKLVKMQIIQTIFMIILFIIAILEKNSIIQREKSFMPFYIISCIVYWLITTIILIIMMNKNEKNEKKVFIIGIILSIEIILLGVFCGSIDRRVDRIEFKKHCDETIATVYDIDKEVDNEYRSDGKYGAKVTYEYYFEYNAYGEIYEMSFLDSESIINRHSSTSARSRAEHIDPKYEIGDEFTIYYNTKNPEDWRLDINYASETTLYIIGFIIIGLRGVMLAKGIMDYNKEKKEANNLV